METDVTEQMYEAFDEMAIWAVEHASELVALDRRIVTADVTNETTK